MATTRKTAVKQPAASKTAATKRAPRPKSVVADPIVAPEEPKAGLVLRGYRLSLRSVEGVSVVVGGNALGGLRLLGIPKGATQKMQRGQRRALHGVTHYSDVAGTKVAHGVGAGKRLAVQGSKKGAKAWVRGMKFFMTLQ
jgi:hypothetical protein